MAGTGRKVWAADEILAASDLQSYIQDQVVFVYNDASARSSGILSPTEGMMSYLKDTNLIYAFDGSSWVEVAPNVGTAGTYTKVTTDAKGRVSSGTTLSASDIPALDSSKITTGNFNANRIDAGTFDIARIPAGTSATQVAYGNHTHSYPQLTAGAINNGGFGCTVGIIYSQAAYDNAVSGLALYVSSGGQIGKGASTARVKKNIVDAGLDVDAVRSIRVRDFVYNPAFVESDGSVQIGVIAEELVELGLEQFVFFEDGLPSGVHYDKLAVAALRLAQVQADRLDAVEARLDMLEK